MSTRSEKKTRIKVIFTLVDNEKNVLITAGVLEFLNVFELLIMKVLVEFKELRRH